MYEFYLNKYDLRKLNFKVSDKKFLFLIYDDNHKYYVKNRAFLDSEDDVAPIKLIKELNKNYKLDIINFYPIVIAKDTLVIAFRTKHCPNSNLKLVNSKKLDKNTKKIIKYHRDNYKFLFSSSNVSKEIQISQKYINRYKIHENIIKRFILTERLRKKNELEKILSILIEDKSSVIDISCGDSSDIFKIAKENNLKTIVGNDICINYLDNKFGDYVIFTNDNIEMNNIKENSYDVSFCKNTLHHMNSLSNINKLLDFLNKISKEIIIMEICNPKECKGLPKFLNKYLYTKFLKDVGNCYLNEHQIKSLINDKFKNYKIEYKMFKNILGDYIIVKIKEK